MHFVSAVIFYRLLVNLCIINICLLLAHLNWISYLVSKLEYVVNEGGYVGKQA